jgi:hypothetical protein
MSKYSFKKFTKDTGNVLKSKEFKKTTNSLGKTVGGGVKILTSPLTMAGNTLSTLQKQTLGITGGISSVFSTPYFYYGIVGVGIVGVYYVFIKENSNGGTVFTSVVDKASLLTPQGRLASLAR